MKTLILTLAALAAVSACSDTRERSASVETQADRPLLVAPPDTSNKVASDISSRGTQPVSPVEQQAPRAEPTPKARPAPRPHKRVAASPKPPMDTLPARGYAPATNPDSATSATPPVDTAKATTPDTTTSVAAADTVADTVAAARTETLPTDTTRPSPDSAVASSGTNTGPASPTSSLDDASQRTVPIGTEIHAALDDSISSRQDSAGRSITAQITESVTGAGGKVLIPAGSTVRLTVIQLASAKSKGSQGKLAFRVDGIEVGGGLQSVQADVRPVPRELRGRGVTSGDAAKVGVGAVGGAVLGRVLGGSTKGAVVGGVVGAAGGAVVASQTATRDVVVKAKTPVTFVLTAPLVTP
jgi:hypothetical protein